MEAQELANSYNNSNAGSTPRKHALRKIAEDNYLLSIKPQGLIWPKKYAKVKSFSYTISTNQIMIRDYKGDIIRKIRFADILRLEPAEDIEHLSVMQLKVI